MDSQYDLQYEESNYKNQPFSVKMKVTSNQWIEIVKLISTFVIGIITTLFVQSCTLSLSVAKNNNNATQRTEQTTTSSVDSTKIQFNH